ncbi:MAG: hypothetical protein EYC70_05965 [Planctomycetota bacterium]|nr:MAG: hypothetical protein EYC70_05965 [Planctomycetota bacterium]
MPRRRSTGAVAEWTPTERRRLRALRSPADIQALLDRIPYSTEPVYRCPRSVLRDGRAHCFDAAVLAAAALERLGHPARLVDLRAVRDDDHVLALFRRGDRYGAVAKSNFSGLRFREPIFRSLRELALSYFEDYFNEHGEKTLRGYSGPVSLRPFERLSWRTEDAAMDAIARRLDAVPHYPLLRRGAAAHLQPVDRRSLAAGMLGVDRRGLHRPRGR